MVKVKGQVTIVVRDIETDEIKRTITEDNVITAYGWQRLEFTNSLSNRNIANNTFMFLSPRQAGSHIDAGGVNYYAGGDISTSGPLVALVDKTISTPYYVEYLNRFQPGPENRTIWTIGICDASPPSTARTAALLNTACTQSTTEVLDVYYRVQALTPLTDPNAFELPTEVDKAWAEWISNLTAPTGLSHLTLFAASNTAFYNSNVVPGKFYRRYSTLNYTNVNGQANNGPVSGSGTDTFRYGQRRYNIAFAAELPATQAKVGLLMRSAINGTGNIPGGTAASYAGLYVNPVVPAGWQPVQPIFNHNSSATRPFLDVGTLASGAGTLNATGTGGTGWTNPDFPELHRININVTGDVGTSRYSFYKRLVTNFNDNSYTMDLMDSLALPSQAEGLTTKYALGNHLNVAATVNTNRVSNAIGYMERLDDTHVVGWDSTGIQTLDVKRNIYRLWDSTTTAALPCTGIRQVDADNNGFAWVADASTGLYKVWARDAVIVGVTPGLAGTWTVRGDQTLYFTVSDTFNVELNTGINTANAQYTVQTLTYNVGNDTTDIVVGVAETIPAAATADGVALLNKTHHFTGADTGLGSVFDTTKCYAVSVGNSRVWALFDGGPTLTGLYYTTDSGATWSAAPGTPPVITDFGGNWSNVMYMRAQKDSQNHRIGFMTSTTGPAVYTGTIKWWSASTAVANGPTITFNSSGSLLLPVGAPALFRVSDTGGWWAYGNDTSNSGVFAVVWGSAAAGTKVGNLNQPATTDFGPTPTFVYDSYGTPYMILSRVGAALNEHDNVIDRNITNLGATTGDHIGQHPIIHLKKNMSIAVADTVFPPNLALGMDSMSSTTDTLNRANTQTQEFVWERYMWDTTASAWKLEWHADAPDSAGVGPYDGARYQFPVESHTFTGRSSIKVPATALSTNFTTTMTVAAQFTSQAKLTGQLSGYNFFQYIDESNPSTNHIIARINDGSGNVTIYQNGVSQTFGATPALGTHTIAIVLSGTSATCFIDGVQLGTIKTLATAVDFSPATGRLVIGGQWYHPELSIVTDDFLRGSMANILVDTTAWTVTEAAALNSTPLTYTGVTAKVRYRLNEAFTGSIVPGTSMMRETKVTHTGFADTLHGAQVKFTNGGSSPAFVATDYYTFGVYDGIMKDNAASFTWNASWYFLPVEHNIATFTPATIPATTTNVTENICWRNYGESSVNYLQPGVNAGRSTNNLYSFQSTTGDFVYACSPSNSISAVINSLHPDTNDSLMAVHDVTGAGSWKWEIRFKSATGVVDIRENGIVVAVSATTYTYGDVFTIRRTGTTITYYKGATLLRTSPITSAARVWMYSTVTSNSGLGATFHDQTITYDQPAYTVKVGDSGLFTGWYDARFFNFDAVTTDALSVSLNGTPATSITIAPVSQTIEAVASPAAGAVTFIPDNGLLLFNSADAGKTVTGRFTVLYAKP